MLSEQLRPAAEKLLAEAGFGRVTRFSRIGGGGNNQVFKAETTGKSAALKVYFYHPDDKRDRLHAEYAFSILAWSHGLRALPRPLAIDRDARLGLYEFVDGRRPAVEEISVAAMDAALTFFASINTPEMREDGAALPIASEACFCLAAHLRTVGRRLQRLEDAPIDRDAGMFVCGEVSPFWRALEAEVRGAAARLGLAPDDEIGDDLRCISPSDFGFHNALCDDSGGLRFLDFEYAGWDDPAKLVGDFFHQVAVPVPPALFARFARGVAALFPAPERNLARFELLLPVYAVKWIAIMLNDFLPEGERRRSFAGNPDEAAERKKQQLIKARRAFAAVSSGEAFSVGRQGAA